MKLPLTWLRDWVDIPWDTDELSRRLTASGFEVEGVQGSGDEAVLELKTYANRGDSMSVLGVAREVAALTGKGLKRSEVFPVRTGSAAAAAGTSPIGGALGTMPSPPGPLAPMPVIDAPEAAPRFLVRRLTGLDNRRVTPAWMAERLARAGLRSISPIVDVTNYVLLDLGQPMHAFDATRVQGPLRVRWARPGETLTLLFEERVVTLTADVLVVADDNAALGLAGVMGGQGTSITADATEVLLEVACFSPDAIAGRARRYGLVTDASQRFERGVDPDGQHRAIDRATALLLELCGGDAGPVQEAFTAAHMPRREPVLLRRSRLALLSGADIADERVVATLAALGIAVVPHAQGWMVRPPSWRFDLAIEADFIEEILRIVGFDAVQESPRRLPQRFPRRSESRIDERVAFDTLVGRGYFEAITYAFVDPALQSRLFPDTSAVRLANPIASDLAVLRTSLWPGLLKAAQTNLARQQDRVRLFERGAAFDNNGARLQEIARLAGVVVGTRQPEQWGGASEPADYFDVKNDVQSLLDLAGPAAQFSFEPASLACLHPGRSAIIQRDGRQVGVLGELHPGIAGDLGFTSSCLLFELDIIPALEAPLPRASALSRYPQVRRDLAVTVPAETPLSTIFTHASVAAGQLLTDLRVFDIYQGAGIEPTRKSVALGLIFQDKSKTLTDADADALMAAVAARLGAELGARVRS